MKTAEEWVNQEYEDEQCLEVSRGFAEKLFKQIQADALRHSAMLCANADNHLCGIAAIENEADKLETK